MWSLLLPLSSSHLEFEKGNVTDSLRIHTSLIFQSKLHTSVSLLASQFHIPHSRGVHDGLATEKSEFTQCPLYSSATQMTLTTTAQSSICYVCLGMEPYQKATDSGEITHGTLELPPLGELGLHSQIGSPHISYGPDPPSFSFSPTH